MSYRIVIDDDVFEQVRALPSEARRAFDETMEVVALVPRNGRPYRSEKPELPMREFVFGPDGRGTVTYLVLEDQLRVDVLLVQWAG